MTEDEAYELKINAERLWAVANTVEDLIESLMRAEPFVSGVWGDFFEPKALPVYGRLMRDLSGDVKAAADKALAAFD